jgi:predicted methyltransferase
MEAGQAVLNELMLSLAQLSRGMTVVELATGIGRFAERVAAEVGVTGRVVATDNSAEMIAYAANRPADPARAPSGGVSNDNPKQLGADPTERVGLLPDTRRRLGEAAREGFGAHREIGIRGYRDV